MLSTNSIDMNADKHIWIKFLCIRYAISKIIVRICSSCHVYFNMAILFQL